MTGTEARRADMLRENLEKLMEGYWQEAVSLILGVKTSCYREGMLVFSHPVLDGSCAALQGSNNSNLERAA